MKTFKIIIELLINELNKYAGEYGEYSFDDSWKIVWFFSSDGDSEPACQINADGVAYLSRILEKQIKENGELV